MGFGLTQYVPFIVYLGLFALFIIVIIYDVRYGIYFLVPFLPFRTIFESIKVYPFGKDLVDLIIVGMIIGWMIRKDEAPNSTPVYLPILLLLIVTFCGVLNGRSNVDTGVGFLNDTRLSDWKNYMMMPLLFVVVFNNIRRTEDIRKTCFIMFAVILLEALLYFKNNRFRSHEHFNYNVRDSGTFGFLGPNHLASFFVEYMLISLSIYFGGLRKDRIKYFCGITFIGSIYPVLFLYSRGAYAGIVAGIATISVIYKRILIVPIVIILLFWKLVLPSAVVERVNMSVEGGEEYENIGNRANIWSQGIQVFKDNPIFGIGYRTFQYFTAEDELKDTHNMYISVMAEMGIIGLITLVFILYVALHSGWALYSVGTDPFLKSLGLGFFISTISVAIMNVFGDRWSYIMMQGFYWTFWALVERGRILSRISTFENEVVRVT